MGVPIYEIIKVKISHDTVPVIGGFFTFKGQSHEIFCQFNVVQCEFKFLVLMVESEKLRSNHGAIPTGGEIGF